MTLEELLEAESLQHLKGHVCLEQLFTEYRLYPTTPYGEEQIGVDQYLGFAI